MQEARNIGSPPLILPPGFAEEFFLNFRGLRPWRGSQDAPPAFMGIQVNFCKSPTCSNYGVPVSPEARRGAHGGTLTRLLH